MPEFDLQWVFRACCCTCESPSMDTMCSPRSRGTPVKACTHIWSQVGHVGVTKFKHYCNTTFLSVRKGSYISITKFFPREESRPLARDPSSPQFSAGLPWQWSKGNRKPSSPQPSMGAALLLTGPTGECWPEEVEAHRRTSLPWARS
jgi:hypothetical protein